jgi:hypothetical protein
MLRPKFLVPFVLSFIACAEASAPDAAPSPMENDLTKSSRKLMVTSQAGGLAKIVDMSKDKKFEVLWDEASSQTFRALGAGSDGYQVSCITEKVLIVGAMQVFQCAASSGGSSVYAAYGVAKDTDKISWSYTDGQTEITNWWVTPSGMMVIIPGHGATGGVWAIDSKTGKLAWSHTLPKSQTPIMFADGSFLFTALIPQPVGGPALVMLSERGEVLFQTKGVPRVGDVFKNPCDDDGQARVCTSIYQPQRLTVVPGAEIDKQR